VYTGSSTEFETEANSTDKSQPFKIKTEDITEHDEKTRSYLCAVFDKRFTTKDDLNVHRRMHTEENEYTCGECE